MMSILLKKFQAIRTWSIFKQYGIKQYDLKPLKTKLLPRNYESIVENETKRLILKIKNKISSERLADIVFC